MANTKNIDTHTHRQASKPNSIRNHLSIDLLERFGLKHLILDFSRTFPLTWRQRQIPSIFLQHFSPSPFVWSVFISGSTSTPAQTCDSRTFLWEHVRRKLCKYISLYRLSWQTTETLPTVFDYYHHYPYFVFAALQQYKTIDQKTESIQLSSFATIRMMYWHTLNEHRVLLRIDAFKPNIFSCEYANRCIVESRDSGQLMESWEWFKSKPVAQITSTYPCKVFNAQTTSSHVAKHISHLFSPNTMFCLHKNTHVPRSSLSEHAHCTLHAAITGKKRDFHCM